MSSASSPPGQRSRASKASQRGASQGMPNRTWLVASQSTPSQHVARREQAVLLADALGRLPADYREVIVLRHLEALPFAEVAQRMGRSENSAQKLWVRALGSLRNAMGVTP